MRRTLYEVGLQTVAALLILIGVIFLLFCLDGMLG